MRYILYTYVIIHKLPSDNNEVKGDRRACIPRYIRQKCSTYFGYIYIHYVIFKIIIKTH